MKVLVTGGAGYIGSHTLIQLIEHGYEPVVFDNLSNSSLISLDRVKQITGETVRFVQGDIRDEGALNNVFTEHNFNAVIHFAGLKAVGESVVKPIMYYENNVFGSLQLFKVMAAHDVKTIVFSSSATVYGDPVSLPLNEEMPTGKPTNPYGKSKLMIENILSDIYNSDNSWKIVNLRYFNPVGAHESALIGELPIGTPQNLVPFVTQTAIGLRDRLSIFGNDYPTQDGTCIRDYIHVVDLAKAHLAAMKRLLEENNTENYEVYNIGTGKGSSVLEVVNTFEEVSRVKLNYSFVERRAGDIISAYADTTKANSVLGWKSELTLKDALHSAWEWEKKNRS